MLARYRIRKDFRVFARCLSDKPPGNDGKTPEENRPIATETQDQPKSSRDKVQELLKLMMAEPKYKESEYKDKFTTAPERRKKQKDVNDHKTAKIDESITKAAQEVAHALGGDVSHTESELLSKVLGKINQTSTNLSDLLTGMKIDRARETEGELPPSSDRGQQVKFMSARRDNRPSYVQRKSRESAVQGDGKDKRYRPTPVHVTTVNIFGGQPLGIFNVKEQNHGTKLDVWEKLKQRELTLATSQPPANYFQKMILWTEQGKVWKFPIDNEQGLESEKNVHFSEHVFLEQHLEGWCPTKGPIRHFMELVCTGLSKNAFYTIQEKKDTIMWYREYFESKKNLLTEVGAWDVKQSQSEVTQS